MIKPANVNISGYTEWIPESDIIIIWRLDCRYLPFLYSKSKNNFFIHASKVTGWNGKWICSIAIKYFIIGTRPFVDATHIIL